MSFRGIAEFLVWKCLYGNLPNKRILSSVVERLHDTQEAGGSIPPGCTITRVSSESCISAFPANAKLYA